MIPEGITPKFLGRVTARTAKEWAFLKWDYNFYMQDESQAEGERELSCDLFLGLRGIARDIFEALGGGEAFIRRERDQWLTSPPDEGQEEGK